MEDVNGHAVESIGAAVETSESEREERMWLAANGVVNQLVEQLPNPAEAVSTALLAAYLLCTRSELAGDYTPASAFAESANRAIEKWTRWEKDAASIADRTAAAEMEVRRHRPECSTWQGGECDANCPSLVDFIASEEFRS